MKIGILFGGRSYEHDISIITATEVFAALNGKCEIFPIYAREGEFRLLRKPLDLRRFSRGDYCYRLITFGRCDGRGAVICGRKRIFLDCMVMCCHGGEGENGNYSALMEVYDIPYTASSVLPSAITMDKEMSKILFEKNGFLSPKAVFLRKDENAEDKIHALHYPLIVKPARLGSSIGIAIAHDASELAESVSLAFSFDDRILIEEVVEDAVELNCAAFSEENELVVSAVERPRAWHEFLTFDDKYLAGKYKGGSGQIEEGEIAESVMKKTKDIYRAFDLFGIARVDYLYSPKDKLLYVNEINSQPGSLAFYLFEEVGMEFSDLLFRVIEEGRKRAGKKGIIKFDTGVLQNLSDLSRK